MDGSPQDGRASLTRDAWGSAAGRASEDGPGVEGLVHDLLALRTDSA